MVAVLAAAAYVVVAGFVATGQTRGIDTRVYQFFRPNGIWGDQQALTGKVVRGLQPRVVIGVLGAVAVTTAWRRRSWRPLVLATLLLSATGAVTILTKMLMGRVGTAGVLAAGLGSFPSGHVASVIACGAGVAMVIHGRARLLAWLLVVVLTCAQSVCLLSIGLHWVSDILGGLLLGVAVASAVGALPLRRAPSGRTWTVLGLVALGLGVVLSAAALRLVHHGGRLAATSAAVSAPTQPPARICDSSSLTGPSVAPPHAVVVHPGDDLDDLTDAHPPGTTFWLAPGAHHPGDGQYSQIHPKSGDRYVGAPGAVLDGRHINQYAFGGQATGVQVANLTIENFGDPGDNFNEGVVNHDYGSGWVLSHLTIQHVAGAGALLGTDNRLEFSCVRDNGPSGFNASNPAGVRNVTVDHNEISGNNTDDWEKVQPGCGCTAGGKFWDTSAATVTDNYVHDNRGVGLWADTDNVGFRFRGNYFAGNDGEGLWYEISYNASIVGTHSYATDSSRG